MIKFLSIYRVLLFLLILILFILYFVPINSCEYGVENLVVNQNIRETNLAYVDIHFSEYQVSVYPELNNIFCLGKVKEIQVTENYNNLLYQEKNIEITTYSSKLLKQFVYVLFLIIQIINLRIFDKKKNHILNALLTILFNFYFFSNLINFILFLILTQLIIYFYFNNEVKTIEAFSILKNKKYYFLLLIFLNFFIAYEMIFEEYFFIGSYLINYNFGFMRRGLIGSFLINLNLTAFEIIILTTLILMFLYSFFQYLMINLLEKNDNIFLNIITFSPLIIFYQFVNTTHLVNSNLMGGEFIGLLTIAYSAFIKDNQNKYNLFLLFLLFNLSIYTHEVNALSIVVIYIILENKKITLVNIFSLSIFSYLYSVNYLNFKERFDPLCEQFKSLKIRENICLGGLSNATFDQINMGIDIYKDFEKINTVITLENKSYIYSVLFFLYFISKIKISKDTRNKSFCIVLIYLPVFLITVDWGRWLNVIFCSLIILYTISDTKKLYRFTKYDLFFYFVLLFTLKHFGTRGVSYIYLDLDYLMNINFYMLFFLFLNNQQPNTTKQAYKK